MSVSAWARNSATCQTCGQSFYSDHELADHTREHDDVFGIDKVCPTKPEVREWFLDMDDPTALGVSAGPTTASSK